MSQRRSAEDLMKVVQRYCSCCGDGTVRDRMRCPQHGCPLHLFRIGEADGRTAAEILRGIRAHCIDCMGGSYAQVKTCPSGGCTLWAYRMGGEAS